jgi:hypothetical protein
MRFPADIITLRKLAGSRSEGKGADVNPESERPGRRIFVERIDVGAACRTFRPGSNRNALSRSVTVS